MKSAQWKQAELERLQAAEQPVKPKPQPVAKPRSCWDDPKFAKRVVEKAERRQAALAAVQRGEWMTTTKSAKEQWEAAVTEIMEKETNGDRGKALTIAKTRYSGILRQMKRQANQ
jgi:cysteine sulfinate desulfinase/cysteine desulfurase-like protein